MASVFGVDLGLRVSILERTNDALHRRKRCSPDNPCLDVRLNAKQHVNDLLPYPSPLFRW